MSEFIYVLTNPTMPNLVKIGRTTDLASRLRSLSSATGVPVPFECFFVCEVSDSLKVEKALHEAFGDHRINEKREFFRINPNRAVAILELVAINNVTLPAAVADTPEELEALHREQGRREVFRFRLADVPVGAVITFSKDSSVTATVVDDKRIDFEGNVTSTSAAAQIILNRMGWNWSAVQGPLYWDYEGESLSERRIRIEDENLES